MKEGWDATGLLQAHWGTVGGRDRLGELTGIQPGTLSGYNTGRLKLGPHNAEKIAAALNVSVLDLGAGEAGGDAQVQSALERLAQLEGDLAEAIRGQTKLIRQVTSLQARVRKLEARPTQGRGVAGGRT